MSFIGVRILFIFHITLETRFVLLRLLCSCQTDVAQILASSLLSSKSTRWNTSLTMWKCPSNWWMCWIGEWWREGGGSYVQRVETTTSNVNTVPIWAVCNTFCIPICLVSRSGQLKYLRGDTPYNYSREMLEKTVQKNEEVSDYSFFVVSIWKGEVPIHPPLFRPCNFWNDDFI